MNNQYKYSINSEYFSEKMIFVYISTSAAVMEDRACAYCRGGGEIIAAIQLSSVSSILLKLSASASEWAGVSELALIITASRSEEGEI